MPEVFPLSLPQTTATIPQYTPTRIANSSASMLNSLMNLTKMQKEQEYKEKDFTMNAVKTSLDLFKDLEFMPNRADSVNSILANDYKLDQDFGKMNVNDAFSYHGRALQALRDPRIKQYILEKRHFDKNLRPIMNMDEETIKRLAHTTGEEKAAELVNKIKNTISNTEYDASGYPTSSVLDIQLADYIDPDLMKAYMSNVIKDEQTLRETKSTALRAQKSKIAVEEQAAGINKQLFETAVDGYKSAVKMLDNEAIPDYDRNRIRQHLDQKLKATVDGKNDWLNSKEAFILDNSIDTYLKEIANGNRPDLQEIIRKNNELAKTSYQQIDVNKNVDIQGMPQGGGTSGTKSTTNTTGGVNIGGVTIPQTTQDASIELEIEDAEGKVKSKIFNLKDPEDLKQVVKAKADSGQAGEISFNVGLRKYDINELLNAVPHGDQASEEQNNAYNAIVKSLFSFNNIKYKNNGKDYTAFAMLPVKEDSPVLKRLINDYVVYKDKNGALKFSINHQDVPKQNGVYQFEMVLDKYKLFGLTPQQLGGKHYSDALHDVYYNNNPFSNNLEIENNKVYGPRTNTNTQPGVSQVPGSGTPPANPAIPQDLNADLPTFVEIPKTDAYGIINPFQRTDNLMEAIKEKEANKKPWYEGEPTLGDSIKYDFRSNFVDMRKVISDSVAYYKKSEKYRKKGPGIPIQPKYYVLHHTAGNYTTDMNTFKTSGDATPNVYITKDAQNPNVILRSHDRNGAHTHGNYTDLAKNQLGISENNGPNENSIGVEFEGTTQEGIWSITDKQIIDFYQYMKKTGTSELPLFSHSELEVGNPDLAFHEMDKLNFAIEKFKELERLGGSVDFRNVLAGINKIYYDRYNAVNKRIYQVGAGINM